MSDFLDRLDASGISVHKENTKNIHIVLSQLFDVLESSQLSDEDKLDALKILERYTTDKVIPTLKSLHPPEKKWKQFHLGVYPFGVRIRVKQNANLTGTTMKYRGAEGTFSYVANGKVFIDFNDDRLNRAPMFSPSDLEVHF